MGEGIQIAREAAAVGLVGVYLSTSIVGFAGLVNLMPQFLAAGAAIGIVVGLVIALVRRHPAALAATREVAGELYDLLPERLRRTGSRRPFRHVQALSTARRPAEVVRACKAVAKEIPSGATRALLWQVAQNAVAALGARDTHTLVTAVSQLFALIGALALGPDAVAWLHETAPA